MIYHILAGWIGIAEDLAELCRADDAVRAPLKSGYTQRRIRYPVVRRTEHRDQDFPVPRATRDVISVESHRPHDAHREAELSGRANAADQRQPRLSAHFADQAWQEIDDARHHTPNGKYP